jgi:hypothetical protein
MEIGSLDSHDLLCHDTTIYLGARTPNRQFEGQLDGKFSAGEYYEMSS